MGFGLVDIVGVLEQESGDPEASFDFDYGKKRDLALAYGFQTLDGLANFSLVLVVLRQSP